MIAAILESRMRGHLVDLLTSKLAKTDKHQLYHGWEWVTQRFSSLSEVGRSVESFLIFMYIDVMSVQSIVLYNMYQCHSFRLLWL